MLKTLFFVLGVAVVIAVVFLIKDSGLVAGEKFDVTSRAYIDESFPAIFGNWSSGELINRASSELLSGISAGRAKQLFLTFSSELGPLQQIESVEGNVKTSLNSKFGKNTVATYKIKAKFQKDSAIIDINLIHYEGKWHYLSFYVSPVPAPGTAQPHNKGNNPLSSSKLKSSKL
ncbi:MAG: hypothetical protein ABI254_11030 [Chthoniobacterales bacterium]